MSCSIHFLNTGHSDCIILESNGHFAMIDAAEDSDYPNDKPHLNYKGYENEVCDYLLKNCADSDGRVILDFILGTHCHSDHIGGFDTVINHPEITVKKAFLKSYYEENIFIFERKRWDNSDVYMQMKTALSENNVLLISEFDNYNIKLGDFSVTFLNGSYKKPKLKFGENVHSVVTLVETDKFRTLLAADMNYKNGGEKKIAQDVGRIDLLKVAHHGYTGSTSAYWLKRLCPKYAVICNSRKRVHPDVLFKLKNISKSKTYCTQDCDGIKFNFNDEITFETGIMR